MTRSNLLLIPILLMAAAIRLHDLVSHAYVLDEAWSLEIATGRGSLHQHVPVDRVVAPPAFYSLADAPPWWHIWSNMEVTHPPLYSLLLRGWEDLFGDTDYNGRLLSVIASLIAIAVLFDTVRLQAGVAPACLAALLMTVACSQVEHARLTRSYTLLTAIALLSVNAIVRIERFGMSRQRWIFLAACLLATLMTHYFCLGALLGLGAWAMLCLPGLRKPLVGAFAAAGLAFVIIWGKWMWRQRHLFATDDPSTLFLTGQSPHHIRDTIQRILLDPPRMLFPQAESGAAGWLAMGCGAALLLLPFVPALRRGRPFVLLWALWLVGTIAVVAALDFSRGTDHLIFIRYTILAGPAVFALIPTLLGRWKPAAYLVSGIAILLCLVNLPDVFHHDDPDPRIITRELALLSPGPDDLLIFAAPPAETTECQLELFMLARYMQPLTCRVAILTHPADPSILRATAKARFVFLDTQSPDPDAWLPGAKMIHGRTYLDLGNVFVLKVPAPNK